jgi:hypothetical protein
LPAGDVGRPRRLPAMLARDADCELCRHASKSVDIHWATPIDELAEKLIDLCCAICQQQSGACCGAKWRCSSALTAVAWFRVFAQHSELGREVFGNSGSEDRRRQDKSVSPVAIQALDRACLSPCCWVGRVPFRGISPMLSTEFSALRCFLVPDTVARSREG